MKRRALAALAAAVTVVVTGLMLSAAPATAQDGHGNIERNEWNIPLIGFRVL
ncbi:hypothetical protein [Streptomyces sp. NPDC059010]|uniref:hypothetical protein n=1 Tax=Streptomyces sp. NPDC059010 TaxID=3346695 RepID=UPI003694F335